MGKEKNIIRRGFLEECLKKLVSGISEVFPEELESLCQFFPELIRPPGAAEESVFQEICRRCGRCIKACPFHAIAPVFNAGDFDRQTPFLRQGDSYCRFCVDFPCIKACPEGALSLKNLEKVPRIGTAVIVPQNCLRNYGESCQACLDICARVSRSAIVIDTNLQIIVKTDICNGCGACAAVCPNQPAGAIKIIR